MSTIYTICTQQIMLYSAEKINIKHETGFLRSMGWGGLVVLPKVVQKRIRAHVNWGC